MPFFGVANISEGVRGKGVFYEGISRNQAIFVGGGGGQHLFLGGQCPLDVMTCSVHWLPKVLLLEDNSSSNHTIALLRYQPGLKVPFLRNLRFFDVQVKLFKSVHFKKSLPKNVFFCVKLLRV